MLNLCRYRLVRRTAALILEAVRRTGSVLVVTMAVRCAFARLKM